MWSPTDISPPTLGREGARVPNVKAFAPPALEGSGTCSLGPQAGRGLSGSPLGGELPLAGDTVTSSRSHGSHRGLVNDADHVTDDPRHQTYSLLLALIRLDRMVLANFSASSAAS